MASKIDAWRQLREETIQNLDIRAKFEEFGVKFTGKVSASNWAECHAFGRDDKNPSAGVNLTSGVYKDFTGDRLSIFDFMVQNGIAPSWQEAQEVLAKSVGLARKIPKKAKAKRSADSLGFSAKFSLASVLPLARKYGITPQVIEMTGARIARYPATSAEPQIVCAFPIFDPIAMLDTPPDSFVLQATSGNPVMVYQGPEAPARPEKRIVVGSTGILNKHALEKWQTADRIYKVEGLTDMLALQHFIPEELRDKHLVITNACGTDDGAPAWGLANHCVGKEIIIIHDADIPGQYGTGHDQTGGAQRWIKALKNSAKVLKNVQLPYEIATKHGKDLRDWLSEPGRKYSDLLELVTSTKDEITNTVQDGTGATKELTPSQKILDRLNLVVLGHTTDKFASIAVFHMRLCRRFYIPDIDKFSYNKMLLMIGDEARTEIDDSPEPSPAKISVQNLKKAIAFEASGRRLCRETAIGIGIWEINGKLIFVGNAQWMAMNGDLKTYQTPEIDGKLVDFGEGAKSWYDEEAIRSYLPHATDPAWRIEFLKEFAGIFARWDNWGEDAEDNRIKSYMLACLALGSWIQNVWPWRPWISITGETNSGKTTLFKMLARYFGPEVGISTGSATEAGLRQELGTTARILMLDEFEASPDRPRILDWLKNSGAGGSSVRGTPGQRSVKGSVKVLPWFGATEAGMKNETERNRYVMFSMASRIGKPWFAVPDDEELAVLRSKSLAVVMRVWDRAKQLQSYLSKSCQIEGVYSRYTENYALPIAMWAAVAGLSNEEAETLFKDAIAPVLDSIGFQTESEHATLITEIITARVNIGRGEFVTVGELLEMQNHELPGDSRNNTPEKVLARLGLKKVTGKDFTSNHTYNPDERVLFISHRIVMKEVLRGSEFSEKGIDQLLMRVNKATRTRMRISGVNARGIAIPFEEAIPFISSLKKETDDFVPEEHRTPPTIGEDMFGDGK